MSNDRIARAALEAWQAGLSVIPVRGDGSKSPPFAWGKFQRERAGRGDVLDWFAEGAYTGFAVIGGAVSGGLEILDFDDELTYQAFLDTGEAIGLGELLNWIRWGYEERTPDGGTHLLFRCAVVGGNEKLAARPDPANPQKRIALIETRAEGGYAILAPSNGSVHPSGRGWRMISGDYASIPEISPDDRARLHALARSFNEIPDDDREERPPSPPPGPQAGAQPGARPGDDFRAKHATLDAFRTIVEAHGWRLVYQRGSVGYFRRPDKDDGVSASFGHAGTDLFYVFTTSTAFESDRGYNPFSVYATLNHGGDFAAATKELGRQGYGEQATFSKPFAGRGSYEETSADPTATDPSDLLWNDRQPLPPANAVPTLDVALIPEPLQRWIAETCDIARIPLEMMAAPAVASLGAVVGRMVGIKPWAFNDFVTVPNVWGLVVARPGWMKSFAVSGGLGMIGRLAKAAHEEYEDAKDGIDAEKAALEAALADIKRRMKIEAKGGGALDDLKAEFQETTKLLRTIDVKERRYLTHDATVEKLAELLVENPRGMLVLRDEVYGLLRSFEKSGRENDRQFYLEGWSGTGSFTTDRIARGTIHIPSLTISIVGGIQPGRLRSLIDEAASGGGGDDGLLQRFQLTVWPDQLASWESPDRWPDSAARERAFGIFDTIDRFTPSTLRAAQDHDRGIPYLTFSPMAQRRADDWHTNIEVLLRSNQLDAAPAFAAHLSKYRSLMPSLALLFHLVESANGTSSGDRIGEASLHRAIAWCDFLEAHARKLYDVELDRGKAAARALATKIDQGAIVDGQTVREIYRNHWTGLKTDEIVIDGLAVLESIGWVKCEGAMTAGRPSQVIRVHPTLRKGATWAV